MNSEVSACVPRYQSQINVPRNNMVRSTVLLWVYVEPFYAPLPHFLPLLLRRDSGGERGEDTRQCRGKIGGEKAARKLELKKSGQLSLPSSPLPASFFLSLERRPSELPRNPLGSIVSRLCLPSAPYAHREREIVMLAAVLLPLSTPLLIFFGLLCQKSAQNQPTTKCG